MVIGRLFSGLRRMRDERTLRRRAIPDDLWALTLARYPFLSRRSMDDLSALRDLVTLFLADKEFHGTQGLVITDEIAVAIAAQACLPILRLGLHYYDSFAVIVVHPEEVVVTRQVMDDDGVVHEYEESIVGEAPGAGPMMLTWHDIEHAGEWAEVAYNVVIHEFAHVIDMAEGYEPDGIPPLPDRAARDAWAKAIDEEYERFCDDLDAGQETLVDPYGAESVDEFFGVTVEAFFVAPDEFRSEHPALYEMYAGYFQQTP
jgi:Mlc titration factor MtfA (ptsG expression regulator)